MYSSVSPQLDDCVDPSLILPSAQASGRSRGHCELDCPGMEMRMGEIAKRECTKEAES